MSDYLASVTRRLGALVFSACAACAIGTVFNSSGEVAAAEPRQAWTTSRVVGTPDPPPPYRVEVAFPKLVFKRPLDLASAPGSDRIFVVEQAGKIYSFANDAKVEQPDLLIDLKLAHPNISSVYGLTFHPDFERNRFAYICYVKEHSKPEGSVVSRFEVSRTDPPTIDPATEKVIITWWSGGHNGGCLKFGPDGCLYISTGDGSGPSPPDSLLSGQDVSNLLSCVLRIDVDHTEGKLAYRVPPDNPLVKVEGARPEIWAYGFRNPWKMSFDRVGGDLWLGDVGWQLWEMIYRVEKGGNYGWAITEGPQPVLPEVKPGPTPILPPVVSHPHSEASSITGGFVYRGSLLPELKGAYIYGDFQTGKVWGLKHDGKQVTWHKELAQTPLQLVAFGEDRSGELLLLDYERSHTLYRLTKNPDTGRHADFPRRLSQTGLFTSAKDQTPAPGVVAYSINAMHWADHTTSERWLAMPGTLPIEIEAKGNWKYPEGSVLAKTVSIELERGSPATRKRLETQILHREEGSWRPYTYRWNDEQTDAELVEASGASSLLKIRDSHAPGGVREQTYRFVSRAECILCHNPWIEMKTTMFGIQTASPLGVTIAQLNRTMPGGSAGENQLALWQQRRLLAGQVPKDLKDAPRYVDPHDLAADINERARSYLNVNCAHCHQLHAGGSTMIDLSYEVKLKDAKTIDVRPVQGTFGISDARVIAPADPHGSVLHYRMAKLGGGRMPRIGSDEVDERGVALIHDWIAQLPLADTKVEARAPRKEDAAAQALLKAQSPDERAAAVRNLTSSTRGGLALARLVQSGDLPAETRQQAVSLGAEHPQTEVRELFERFVPASRRIVRLGSSVNATELLALRGDIERGRQLFFRDGAASCKSCHRVNNAGETLGPDLSQIGKKYPPKELLTHLLEPSKTIEPKYVSYLLETVDGQFHSGLLVEKNERETLLKTAQNKELRVPAGEIERLVPQPKSLMPDLLLRDLTPQQAADLLAFLVSLQAPGQAAAAPRERSTLKVHLVGAGEYSPVESLTEYKKYLEQNYRVGVSTSFGKDGKSLPNLESLKSADVMLIFVRRMNLPEEQMALIRSHWEQGKAIVALRTASHGFQAADIEAFSKVLGGAYTGPGSYTAPYTAIAAEGKSEHPVLKGVGPIPSRGCYNFSPLAEKAEVLQIVESEKKKKAPVTWVHEHNAGRTFYSTMGVPEDFKDENFRRLLANAIFWTSQREPELLRQDASAAK